VIGAPAREINSLGSHEYINNVCKISI